MLSVLKVQIKMSVNRDRMGHGPTRLSAPQRFLLFGVSDNQSSMYPRTQTHVSSSRVPGTHTLYVRGIDKGEGEMEDPLWPVVQKRHR